MEIDIHPIDISTQIRKSGWTLRALDRAYGLAPGACSCALTRPYAAAEVAIAAALGREPRRIWPSRYNRDGRRKRPQPSANYHTRPRHLRSARKSDIDPFKRLKREG